MVPEADRYPPSTPAKVAPAVPQPQRRARYLVIGLRHDLAGYARGTWMGTRGSVACQHSQSQGRAFNLPDNAAVEVLITDVESYQVVRIADEFIVDLLAKACGVGIEEALPAVHRRLTASLFRMPCANADSHQGDRPAQDKQDLLFLREKDRREDPHVPARRSPTAQLPVVPTAECVREPRGQGRGLGLLRFVENAAG